MSISYITRAEEHLYREDPEMWYFKYINKDVMFSDWEGFHTTPEEMARNFISGWGASEEDKKVYREWIITAVKKIQKSKELKGDPK